MALETTTRWRRAVAPRLVILAAIVLGGSSAALALDPYPGQQPVKDADRDTVGAGGTIVWTIQIFNDAADDPASVFLSDDVPDTADNPAFGPFNPATDLTLPPGATFTYNNDLLSVSNISVPARQSVSLVLRTRVNADAPDGLQVCNQAHLRYMVVYCEPGPFPICDDNTYQSSTRPSGATAPGPDCVTIRAAGAPDIVPLAGAPTNLADSCPGDPTFPAPNGRVSPGETLTLTLAVQNAGPVNAPGTPVIQGTLQPGAGYTVVQGASNLATVPANTLLANRGNIGSNVTPFVLRVDADLLCPSTIVVPLSLTNVTGGPFTVNYTYRVGEQPQDCTVCGAAAPCLATAEAVAEGPTRFCEGGTVRLDASGSQLTNCSGATLYQWRENGNLIAGASFATYDTPGGLAPGGHAYTVDVSCSSEPSCTSTSDPVDVTVDATPLVVNLLLETRRGNDITYLWTTEATAVGGYRLYRTDLRPEAGSSRGDNPNANNVVGATSPDPLATTLTLVDEVRARPDALYYQTIAVCSDDATEGPN